MIRRIGIVMVLAALAAGGAHAQSKTGTSIGQFLLIEPSARFSAMGNVGVALYDGIQGVYYNPAALGSVDRYALQASHSDWLAGIDYDYLAVGAPFGTWGSAMLSVTYLGSGEMDVRTVERPHGTGERYSVSDLAVGLAYGRPISDRFSAGAQLNYIQETIWHTSMRSMVLNVGAIYRISENGLHIGSSISNIGTKGQFKGRDLAMQYDNDPDRYGDNSALPGERYTGEFPLPILFRVGLGLPQRLSADSRVLLEVDAFHPSDNTEAVSMGAEWTWKEMLSLRGGYQNLAQEDTETGLTLGIGLKGRIGQPEFQFDYSWADYGRLEETHRLTFVLIY